MRKDTKALLLAWGITLASALPIVLFLPDFFAYLAGRNGRLLQDPVLKALPSIDVSVPLFVGMYLVVAIAVVGLSRHPVLFLRTAQAYVLLLLLRMLTMFVFTLEPPPGLIELQDPISTLFYPGQVPFRKDLFFSGHTATIYLLFLAAPWRPGRWALLVATALVGIAVLVQHVHWTVDVLLAPPFAWLAWRISAFTVRSYTGRLSQVTVSDQG